LCDKVIIKTGSCAIIKYKFLIFYLMEGIFIKNFIIIGLILGAVFFSQNANLLGNGKNFTFISGSVEQAKDFLAKGSDWAISKVYPNIIGEAQKRGEMALHGVASQVDAQKEKVSENISGKIKNYFSGVANSIVHPDAPQNCSAGSQPSR